MSQSKIIFKTSNKSDLGGPLNALTTLEILTLNNSKVSNSISNFKDLKISRDVRY